MNKDSFGMALKAARKRSGLTQGGVADKIAEVEGLILTQQVISNWERNVNLPGERSTFMILCKALYQSNGLTSVEQINELLEPAEEGALHRAEIAQWFPELVQADLSDEGEALSRAMSSTAGQEQGGEEQQQVEEQQNNVFASERAPLSSIDMGNRVHPRPLAPSLSLPFAPSPLSFALSHSEQPLIHRLLHLQQKLREHLGAIGAVILVMWLMGLFWRTRAWWVQPVDAWQIIVVLWCSTLFLSVLPSLIEQEAEHYPILQLKLSRLSGVGSALTIITGFLLWMEALWQVIFESPLALWLLYPLIILGAASAYAVGVNVQFWFYQQRNTYEKAYLRNTIMMTLSSFAAQALLVWSSYLLYSQLPDIGWHILMLTPPVLMILVGMRR